MAGLLSSNWEAPPPGERTPLRWVDEQLARERAAHQASPAAQADEVHQQSNLPLRYRYYADAKCTQPLPETPAQAGMTAYRRAAGKVVVVEVWSVDVLDGFQLQEPEWLTSREMRRAFRYQGAIFGTGTRLRLFDKDERPGNGWKKIIQPQRRKCTGLVLRQVKDEAGGYELVEAPRTARP